ncbi:hypothetical protein TRIUR3_30510 [Triticum urartu]|uniref:Uncharacterized protein n=1 Tax=Triticum urartu TaxID=4572 RepID=M7ZCV7_TRIUA|nr:hypothetical protein TRIUR3_30510 [Triticum urartu]
MAPWWSSSSSNKGIKAHGRRGDGEDVGPEARNHGGGERAPRPLLARSRGVVGGGGSRGAGIGAEQAPMRLEALEKGAGGGEAPERRLGPRRRGQRETGRRGRRGPRPRAARRRRRPSGSRTSLGGRDGASRGCRREMGRGHGRKERRYGIRIKNGGSCVCVSRR